VNKSLTGALCAGLFSLGLAASVDAVPLTEQSLIQVEQLENAGNGTEISENFTTTNSSVSSVLDTSSGGGSNVQGYANLTTAQSGTFVATPVDLHGGGAYTTFRMFDTLKFSTSSGNSVDISYALNLDGSISNIVTDSTSPFRFGGGSTISDVSIYDITGLNSWLNDSGGNNIFTLAPRISSREIFVAAGSQIYLDAFSHITDQSILDTSGIPVAFDLSKTGTFTADPNKTYGIRISSSSDVTGGGGTANFLNTSDFSFTDLNGATFTSGSGVFLSPPTSVPEPSILALLGIGLVGFMRRNRNRQ